MDCLKLLFISDAEEVGGAEMSLYTKLKKLDRKKFNPKIIVPHGRFSKKLKQLNTPLKQLELNLFHHSNPVPFIKTVFQLKKEIQDFNPDWVIANGFNACEYSCLAAQLANRKFCYFVRDFPEILNTWLRKLCFRKADLLIANSQAVRNEMIDWFGLNPEKITVSYPPIDINKFKPLPKNSSKLKKLRKELSLQGKFVVGCFARLSREKGQNILIEAVKQLNDPKIKLLIVGNSKIGSKEFEKELKALAKPLSENCVFTGFRNDLAELMNVCDVIVCPPKKEPFGRVILEGIACGKPVIAANASGAKEIIENGTGVILIPLINIQTLAQTIKLLVKNRNKLPKTAKKKS